MAEDANGPEASLKFLEANKTKEGVNVLPSGLQYKVLKNAYSPNCPTVNSPCECHYAGTLIDGTEFDSSYARGKPTTFAPNQVIKGWTEAMQLMGEGDKWEMYIPMELAYGPNGQPPKIPAAAALIFQMEIIKIKGDKVTRKVEYPEWTPEQLVLWTEDDAAKLLPWRESRAKMWEEGKMRDDHPTREGFDSWLEKQCLSTKNKTLVVRVRKAAEPPPVEKTKLTKEKARALLTKALETFKEPANKETLLGVIKECDAMDPSQAGMMKMMKLMPAVSTMMSVPLKEYGYGPNDLLAVTMEIQALGSEDKSIADDVMKLQKAVQGDFGDLLD